MRSYYLLLAIWTSALVLGRVQCIGAVCVNATNISHVDKLLSDVFEFATAHDDFTLTLNGKQFRVCKVLVCARSTYIRFNLTHSFRNIYFVES